MRKLLFLLPAFICSAAQAQAAFSMDGDSGCVPLCISFQDQAVNAQSWMWNFGDATTSAVQNPFHCYNTPGTYTVTLTETFSSGTSSATGTVTVFQNPVAAFTAVASGNTLTFTDQSAGATAWYWNFGDTTSSTQQNPSHTYLYYGIDTVCLQITDIHGCQDTTCQPVAVQLAGITDVVHPAYQWEIYPNPSAGRQFTLTVNGILNGPEEVQVLNALGEIVLAQTITGTTTFSLEGDAPGMYVVRIGNRVTKKLLLE